MLVEKNNLVPNTIILIQIDLLWKSEVYKERNYALNV